MIINWYGEGCFKIQTGGVTILTDPFLNSLGLTPPRIKPDLLIKTASDPGVNDYWPSEEADEKSRPQEIVIGPGEYEIKGVEIYGWPIIEKTENRKDAPKLLKTVYLLKAEEMKLGLLGHLEMPLDASTAENFAGLDIMFIPAGGEPFLSQDLAVKLIKQLNPKIIIPSFFKIPGLKRKTDEIKKFLDALGKKTQSLEKLVVRKKELPLVSEVAVLKI